MEQQHVTIGHTTTETVEKVVIDWLQSTQREGIGSLIDYLKTEGFFTAPASTRYHGCYEGGLARHSLNVFNLLSYWAPRLKLAVTPEDQTAVVIASLLHDICKVGAYKPTREGSTVKYSWNKEQPKGHGLLSVIRCSRFITLTELEEAMITYHMGVYGLHEFEEGKGEYPLRGGGLANVWFHKPLCKLMYFCDELATFQEKAEEGI